MNLARLSCDGELVLVVVEPALVRRVDEAVDAVGEVDHELLPPRRMAAASRGRGREEPAQVLLLVPSHGADPCTRRGRPRRVAQRGMTPGRP